jgi:hypothetical protein
MSRTKRWIAQQKFRELNEEDLPTYKVGDLFKCRNSGQIATLSRIVEQSQMEPADFSVVKTKRYVLFINGSERTVLEIQLRVAYDYLTPSK